MLPLLFLTYFICITRGFKVNAGSVEQWDRFEIQMNGPSNGNPFVDNYLNAVFTFKGNGDNDPFNVNGFYDGNGIYKIRFMPNQQGTWSYVTKSNVQSMNNQQGTFTATPPSKNNHGPAYADPNNHRSFIFANGNEPFFQTGTTSYAWRHQSMDVQNETIKTLKYTTANKIFNKIRMLVFPKWYEYSHAEPLYYPYIGTPPNNWGNFDKFNVPFWQHLDWSLDELIKMELDTGNQLIADVVLFHPYDNGHWGFDCMGCPFPTYKQCSNQPNTYNVSNDLFYLKYIVARIASYRNVWWSMANEYDIVHCKSKGLPNTYPIWDSYFKALINYDPYRNPEKEKSIHQCNQIYNYSRSWTTHFSIQGYWSVVYEWFNNQYNVRKPVILDEVQYEGNISSGWGSLNAKDETDRFWQGNSDGVYVGHSECVLKNKTNDPDGTQILWWNYGGELRGESYERIGWFNRWMTNKTLHPVFNDMRDFCLTWNNGGFDCEISQLYKENVYYLLHWTFFQNNYNMKAVINVTSNDEYELSVINYFDETITSIKTVKGPIIEYTAPQRPYDIQLVNTKSKYYVNNN